MGETPVAAINQNSYQVELENLEAERQAQLERERIEEERKQMARLEEKKKERQRQERLRQERLAEQEQERQDRLFAQRQRELDRQYRQQIIDNTIQSLNNLTDQYYNSMGIKRRSSGADESQDCSKYDDWLTVTYSQDGCNIEDVEWIEE